MNIDDMNLKFIIAAYSVSWLVILGYLARLVRKGSRVRGEYARMQHDTSAGTP